MKSRRRMLEKKDKFIPYQSINPATGKRLQAMRGITLDNSLRPGIAAERKFRTVTGSAVC